MDEALSPLELACEAVVSGGAVCLLGAGFSTAGQDHSGEGLPSTTDLIREIKVAIGLEHEDVGGLADITDYCEDRPELQLILRKLLLDRLTLSKPSPEQQEMLRQPWRSVFTTNFDDIVENALPSGMVQVITPNSNDTIRYTPNCRTNYSRPSLSSWSGIHCAISK
jgi:hypothetical protein